MSERAEHASRFVKATTPTALGLLGVIMLSSPIRLFEGHVPTPLIPLLVVYFWSIYSPSYLPSVSVFFIGLLQDLLLGGPLGLWASIYLFVQFLVLSQRSYFHGRDQTVVWMGFAVAGGLAALILWLVMSMMSGMLLPVVDLLIQFAATIAIYPVIAGLFAQFHRRVVVEG